LFLAPVRVPLLINEIQIFSNEHLLSSGKFLLLFLPDTKNKKCLTQIPVDHGMTFALRQCITAITSFMVGLVH
jgi:hypothetical protein